MNRKFKKKINNKTENLQNIFSVSFFLLRFKYKIRESEAKAGSDEASESCAYVSSQKWIDPLVPGAIEIL